MNTSFEPDAIEPSSPAKSGGCGSVAAFVLVMVWIAVLAYLRQAIALVASATPIPLTNGWGPWLTAGLSFLLILPVVPLAYKWTEPRYRAIYRTWALAILGMILLIPAQFPDIAAGQTRAALHIILALIFSALLTLIRRKTGWSSAEGSAAALSDHKTSGRIPVFAAILAAGLMAIPWFAWGALGSPLDTLLQVLAALSFGLAAGLLLDGFLLRPYLAALENPDSPRGSDRLLLALASSIALLILAAGTGFPFGGMQLLLMLVLTAAGWLVPGLRSPAAAALLVGLAAAAPMVMIDADELALVISASQGETLQWATQAAGVGMLIALVPGVLAVIFPFLDRLRDATARAAASLAALLSAAVWLVGAVVYLAAGQPGFYGESLFVIFEDQADLAQARSITDVDERRSYVYQTLVDTAQSSQAALIGDLERFGIDYTPYYLENAILVRADPLAGVWIAAQPGVDRVLPNPQMRPLPEQPPASSGISPAPEEIPWNLTLIHAERVWSEFGVSGEGIVVGQSDTGVDGAHPDLAGAYRGRETGDDYNWLDPWYGRSQPADIGGHGTHTLGTVLGARTGVAPGAEWIGCVNLARNLGSPSHYMDCMQFMLAPYPQDGDPLADGRPDLGANVINNSWGCPPLEGCDLTSLQAAVRALRAAGVFVGVSAGNDGPLCGSLNTPPALYPEAFVTGAIDSSGGLAFFSSLGPTPEEGGGEVKPNLVAPGVEVLSTFPNATYSTASGTSMAGPHTVGVVALMWSANPDLIGDIDRTEEILEASTQPYQGNIPACQGAGDVPSTAVGYGVLDAYQAVRMVLSSEAE